MSEWKKVKLGDYCEITSSKRCLASVRSKNGIPFFCSKEIICLDKGEDFEPTDFIPEELYNDIKAKYGVPTSGDLLLTTRGTNGIPYIYKPSDKFYFADGNLSWFKNFGKELSPQYLYYWFKSPLGIHEVDAISKGTAQKAVPIDGLRRIVLLTPSQHTQNRIVAILSRYDSLIENYQKQIKLLEEAAQRLYKEWFIDLHFPGHENTNIIDGVPEGWEKKKVGELLIKQIGGGWGKDTPTGSYDVGGHVIRGTDISQIENGHMAVPYRYHMESNLKDRRLKEGDIIFEVSGGSANEPVGRTLFITNELVSYFGGNTICASFCKKMSFRMISESVIAYYTIRYFRGIGYLHKYEKDSAGKIINYNWNDFLNEFDILLPNQDMLGNISTRLQKFITEASKLKSQLRLLTEARDRLLPKLMSGEIEV